MNPEDVDRALRQDETIAPSPDFTARVMRAVREEAEDLGPIDFPWLRMVPAWLVGLATVILAIATAPTGAGAFPPAAGRLTEAIPPQAALAALSSLAGSWILVRFSFRLAGYRR
jgi:hypothetical protein